MSTVVRRTPTVLITNENDREDHIGLFRATVVDHTDCPISAIALYAIQQTNSSNVVLQLSIQGRARSSESELREELKTLGLFHSESASSSQSHKLFMQEAGIDITSPLQVVLPLGLLHEGQAQTTINALAKHQQISEELRRTAIGIAGAVEHDIAVASPVAQRYQLSKLDTIGRLRPRDSRKDVKCR